MSEESVKLGVMPPLTGLVGIYGSEIVHAAQVACQEINEKGGVLGRPLELVIEDDGSLPDSAVIAAKKLIDDHKCAAIIGNLLSNSRIAVAYGVAEPRKVPYLNFSFYEGSIISPYFFHFAALPNQQIDKMIPYMRNKFGPRMFFAGNNYEWPRGSIHAGKLALEKAGGEVVGEEYTPIGVEPDVIEKLLDHVEAANPDVFVPYFAGSDQALLLTRFTERGLKDRITVVMGHYDEMMASQLPPEVRDGFYSSNTYFMTIDSEENKNYKSRLANLPDVNGIWPEGNGILTNFGEGTYICVKAFAEAANMAGSLDPEVLREELDAIRIKAPQGTVEMNPEHHHARVNTYLSQCDAKGVFNIIENFGAIEPVMPARYRHQQIASQATLEDDIRLQARILEQMTDGVILTSSADGTIVYVNTGAEKLFGYDKDEMVGLPIATINDPNDNNPHDTAEEIMRILNQTGEWQGEIRNIKKDGTAIWCSSTISTFTHPTYGEVWLGVQHEITQIKNTESALRESEAQLKDAQRIAKVGGWELDIVGNHLKWTDETYDIFEVGKDDFNDAYESFLSIVHPDDAERVEKDFTDSIKNHKPYEIEHRILMQDGRIKFVRETCETKYSHDDQPLYSKGIVQDITERVEQENALRESEERLRMAMSAAEMGTWKWNLVSNQDTRDANFNHILGLEAVESTQLVDDFVERIHPDDRAAVDEKLKIAIRDNNIYLADFRIIQPDGTERWLRDQGLSFYDEKNKISYMTGVVVDITERKNAEEEIQRLASIVKHSSDFIGIADIEGHALFVNDAGRKMVGLEDDEELLNSKVMGYFPDDEQERVVNEIMPALMDKDKGRWTGEINFQNFKNGNVFPVWFDFFRIDDPNTGQPINFGTVTQDLTSRKNAEELRDLKHKVSQATTSALSVYVSDMESVRNIFEKMLSELLDITGSEYGFIGEIFYREDGTPYLKTQAITDISWNEETKIFYQEKAPQGMEFTNLDSLFGNTIKTAEYTVSNDPANDPLAGGIPEGHPALNSFLGVPLNIGGELVGMVGIANRKVGYDDYIITPLKPFFQSCANVISAWRETQQRILVEKELLQYKDKLELLVEERTKELKNAQDELVRKERLATLGQLTATVSHELRNPLGAMRPSIYMLKKKCDKSDERTKIAIERLDRNIDRCDRIIDELLDFTRIVELHKESILIDEWLESVVDDQILPEGIQLEKNYSLKDIKLEIDAELLRRAVINVFENGCHAMMDDNQQLVNKKNAYLKIKTTSNKNRIEISITDTGSGISEGVLSKIFEPLFSTKGFGVGLGMPTVKQIMEQHGGGINIESDEGKGTTITLWLPMKLAEDDEK